MKNEVPANRRDFSFPLLDKGSAGCYYSTHQGQHFAGQRKTENYNARNHPPLKKVYGHQRKMGCKKCQRSFGPC